MWIQSFDERRFGYGAAVSVVMLLLSSVFAVSTSGAPAATRWAEGADVARGRPFRLTNVLLTAVVIALALVFVYPVFLTVMTSLKTQDAVLDNPLGFPHQITFDAYVTTWRVLAFGRLLLNSLFYAAVGAGIELLLAIYPAYAFSRFRFIGGRRSSSCC